MGVAWWFVGPLLTTAVLVAAFAGIFGIPRSELADYTTYVLSGVVFVNFVTSATLGVTTSVANNRTVIGRVQVWAFSYPVVSMVVALVSFLIGLLFVLVASILAGNSPSFLVVFPIVFLLALVFGVGVTLAVLHVHSEDVGNILPVLLQALFYLTPVFYQESQWPDSYSRFLGLNPLLPPLRLFRDLTVAGNFQISDLVLSLMFAMVSLAIGVVVLSRNWQKIVARL